MSFIQLIELQVLAQILEQQGDPNIEAIANWPARNNQVLYAANGGDLGTLNTTTGAFTLIANVDANGPAQGC
jgi:hypothetical protein